MSTAYIPPEERQRDLLTKQECFTILSMWKDWNMAQTSVSRAFAGARTEEDDIYDARRRLIITATKRLEELCRP